MWTPERIETLTKMWSEGASAGQIARRIGDISRNAVIGKVHRLGLSGRAQRKDAGNLRTLRPRIKPPESYQARRSVITGS